MDREAERFFESAPEAFGVEGQSPDAIDPDHPHWGPLAGIGVWLLSYLSPFVLLTGWLIFEQLLGLSAPLSREGLKDWITTPRAILISLFITLAGHLLILGICWALVTRSGRQPFLATLGWNWGGLSASGRFYLVFGVVAGIFVLRIVLRFVLPENEATPFDMMLKSSPLVKILIALMAVLTAPIAEEVVYRGVLYSGLRAKIGATASIIAVTLLFTVVHYEQYQGAWASIGGLLALSFALTVIRAVTRSLLPCVVIHLTYNLIGAVLILQSI